MPVNGIEIFMYSDFMPNQSKAENDDMEVNQAPYRPDAKLVIPCIA